jgi:anti-sigma B factor antagonist
MLNAKVQTFGSIAIVRCQGRIVAGDENAVLRKAVLPQAACSTLVLDLAAVAGIDAGGLGALLGLHASTRANGMQLKLMNVPNIIQQVLEVTHLDRVLDICSENELVDLVLRAASMAASGPCLDQDSGSRGECSGARWQLRS